MTEKFEPSGAPASERAVTRREIVRSAAAFGVGLPLAGTLLSACGSAGGTAGKGGASELVVAAPTTPPGLDWELFFGHEVYDHVFNLNDRLTHWKRVRGGQPGSFDLAWSAQDYRTITEPRMAESWDVSKDGTVYTLHLRKGWPSHAGNEFTAEDVRWSIERSFALKGIGLFFNTIANIKDPQSVKVIDKHTVQIKLSAPTPDLLLTLSTFWRAIADSTAAKAHATSADPWAKAWMKTHDVGFGPYKLETLAPGDQVSWVAHAEHPFPAKIKRIVFREVPDSATRVALLSSGEVGVAQFVTPTDLQKLQGTNGVKVWNFPGYVILQSPMNPKFPPFDDVRVRQALSYATPYEAIVKDVYHGYARPAAGPVSDHVAGFDRSLFPYRYDLERARELLREAGHPNGFSTWFAYSTADPLGELVGIQLRSAFAQVGVKLDLRALPPAAYTETLFGARAPMVFFSLGADSPDPNYALSVFYLSTSSNNWGGYRSPAADAALARAGRQLDWPARIEADKKAYRIIVDDAAWLWIAQPGFQVSTRSNLTGLNWYAGEAVDWSIVDYAA